MFGDIDVKCSEAIARLEEALLTGVLEKVKSAAAAQSSARVGSIREIDEVARTDRRVCGGNRLEVVVRRQLP